MAYTLGVALQPSSRSIRSPSASLPSAVPLHLSFTRFRVWLGVESRGGGATMAGTVSSNPLVQDSWSWSDGCSRDILGKVFATGADCMSKSGSLSNDEFFLKLLGGPGSVSTRKKTTAPKTSTSTVHLLYSTVLPSLSLISIIYVFGPVANAPRHTLYSTTVLTRNASSILAQ
jgi:hypothetical protein